ncbi:membrane-spanning 4-domains subfamily A member 4A-like [Phascolarctos cinereus]
MDREPGSNPGSILPLTHTGYGRLASPLVTQQFILSGSLSIAAETTKDMVIESSLRLNIVSAFISEIGIYLLLDSLDTTYYFFHHYATESDVYPMGFSTLLGNTFPELDFTILEFTITISLSGYGCHVTYCYQSRCGSLTMLFSPYVQEVPTDEIHKEVLVIQVSDAEDKFPGMDFGIQIMSFPITMNGTFLESIFLN